MKASAVLSGQPRRHAKVIDVGMRDHRIRHTRCFVWVTRWVGRCKAIIEEEFGSRWILHHDADVPNFVTAPKAVKTKSLLRWERGVGGRATRIVHHHAMTKMVSTMNLWTYPPWFPLDSMFGIRTTVFSDFHPEHDRPHSPYIPMTSSIRHSSFDVFAP